MKCSLPPTDTPVSPTVIVSDVGDPAGGFIKEWTLRKQSFLPLLERAGLPIIRFRDLRHTHATQALSAGLHPKVVSERLGHSTVSITLDTYSHVIPALQEEAAEQVAALVFG